MSRSTPQCPLVLTTAACVSRLCNNRRWRRRVRIAHWNGWLMPELSQLGLADLIQRWENRQDKEWHKQRKGREKGGEERKGGTFMKVKEKPRQSASVWLLRRLGLALSQSTGFFSSACHQQAKWGWLYNNKTNTTFNATTWIFVVLPHRERRIPTEAVSWSDFTGGPVALLANLLCCCKNRWGTQSRNS